MPRICEKGPALHIAGGPFRVKTPRVDCGCRFGTGPIAHAPKRPHDAAVRRVAPRARGTVLLQPHIAVSSDAINPYRRRRFTVHTGRMSARNGRLTVTATPNRAFAHYLRKKENSQACESQYNYEPN